MKINKEKKILVILAILLLIFAWVYYTNIEQEQDGIVEVVVLDTNGNVGFTVDIPLYVYNVTDLGSGEIRLRFDDEKLSFYNLEGQYTMVGNQIDIPFTTLGVSGDYNIFTISFSCLEQGDALVEIISCTLLDSSIEENEIPCEYKSGTVTIGEILR